MEVGIDSKNLLVTNGVVHDEVLSLLGGIE
jgi:hypothetical protein